MGGDVWRLFDRTMAMSQSTVVKTEISPSDLGAHHIEVLDTPTHVCQQFGSVTALLKDQNDKLILNKFKVYTRGNTEMGLLSARRRIKFTIFLFFYFFAAAAHPTPHRDP